MRIRLPVFVFVAVSLGACNTPSVGFMGVPAQTVTVKGSTFDVRRKGNKAELIRTNMEATFSLRALIPRAAQAVVLATGCAPVDGTWSGDHALMQVTLDC